MPRPKDLPPGPQPYSADFSQTLDGFDPDALVLLLGHPKWDNLLKYHNPVSGQTWTVPNAWYNKPRSSQIEMAQWSADHCMSVAINLESRRERDPVMAARQRVFAAGCLTSIILMQAELERVKANLDDFRKTPQQVYFREGMSISGVRWQCYKLHCDVEQVTPTARGFVDWSAAQWTLWGQSSETRPSGHDRRLHATFDKWLELQTRLELESIVELATA